MRKRIKTKICYFVCNSETISNTVWKTKYICKRTFFKEISNIENDQHVQTIHVKILAWRK